MTVSGFGSISECSTVCTTVDLGVSYISVRHSRKVPDSERSDRKRKNVKSVISIIIHNLKFQLQKDCNRYIKTAVDHPTKDSIYRSLLKDIIS